MTDFSLFGVGRNGLPDEVDLWLDQPGEVERMAEDIIAECEAKALVALNRTRRPHPTTEIASRAFLLVAWLNKHGRPIPPMVMNALAHAMGLVSYAGGSDNEIAPRSAVSDELRARVGFPASLEMFRLSSYQLASRFDGEADAAGGARLKREALAEVLLLSARTVDAWRKQDV